MQVTITYNHKGHANDPDNTYDEMQLFIQYHSIEQFKRSLEKKAPDDYQLEHIILGDNYTLVDSFGSIKEAYDDYMSDTCYRALEKCLDTFSLSGKTYYAQNFDLPKGLNELWIGACIDMMAALDNMGGDEVKDLDVDEFFERYA